MDRRWRFWPSLQGSAPGQGLSGTRCIRSASTYQSKIVACKQVQIINAEAALDEYDHMRLLRGAPHIATLHDGLEFNRRTNTLSFFMDYYKGKDLDRQVQMLRGAAQVLISRTMLARDQLTESESNLQSVKSSRLVIKSL